MSSTRNVHEPFARSTETKESNSGLQHPVIKEQHLISNRENMGQWEVSARTPAEPREPAWLVEEINRYRESVKFSTHWKPWYRGHYVNQHQIVLWVSKSCGSHNNKLRCWRTSNDKDFIAKVLNRHREQASSQTSGLIDGGCTERCIEKDLRLPSQWARKGVPVLRCGEGAATVPGMGQPWPKLSWKLLFQKTEAA